MRDIHESAENPGEIQKAQSRVRSRLPVVARVVPPA